MSRQGRHFRPNLLPGVRDYFAFRDVNPSLHTNLAPGSAGAPVVGVRNVLRGPYGPEDNFNSGYGLKPLPQFGGTAGGYPGKLWPLWMAAAFRFTGVTSDCFAICAGNASSNNPAAGLRIPNTTSVAWFIRDDATSSGSALASQTVASLADSQIHVLMGVSFGVSDHRVYFDGRLLASATTLLGATTLTHLGVGVFWRNSSPFGQFTGRLLAAAVGAGAVPSPSWLAANWRSRAFAELQPAADRRAYLSLTAEADPDPAPWPILVARYPGINHPALYD